MKILFCLQLLQNLSDQCISQRWAKSNKYCSSWYNPSVDSVSLYLLITSSVWTSKCLTNKLPLAAIFSCSATWPPPQWRKNEVPALQHLFPLAEMLHVYWHECRFFCPICSRHMTCGQNGHHTNVNNTRWKTQRVLIRWRNVSRDTFHVNEV